VEKNIPIKSVFNHRVSFAFYFDKVSPLL
jgi:hypothetical protein